MLHAPTYTSTDTLAEYGPSDTRSRCFGTRSRYLLGLIATGHMPNWAEEPFTISGRLFFCDQATNIGGC